MGNWESTNNYIFIESGWVDNFVDNGKETEWMGNGRYVNIVNGQEGRDI